MFIEIGCIIGGIPIGLALRKNQRIVHTVDRCTMWTIYGLLFLLGVSLGTNEQLFSQLATLGLRALVISLCCLLGSAAAAWSLDRFILRGRFDER